MTIKIGINGLGRMGRLTLRAALDSVFTGLDVQFVQSNDPAGDAATMAHLLNFDSVHGRWQRQASVEGESVEGESSENESIVVLDETEHRLQLSLIHI